VPESVIAVVLNPNKDKIVTVKRCDVPVWVLPGGGIDFGETPENAVVREVFEETGLKVEIVRKVGEYYPSHPLAQYTYVFECSPIDGQPAKGSETRDISFASINMLPEPFLPVHQYWIDDTLQQSQELIRGPVKGVTWKLFGLYCLFHPVLMFRYLLSKCGFPINTRA